MDIHVQNNELQSIYVPYAKINSEWFTDLHGSKNYKTYREENTEKSLCDLGLGKNFLDMISNLMSVKRTNG